MGRWLAAEHPDITEPGPVDPADLRGLGRGRRPDGRRRLLPVAGRQARPRGRAACRPRPSRATCGWPARSSATCQEWEWIPRRFDPAQALGTPRSIRALLGPDPRVIADDIWAKLLWAGLNLEPADLARADRRVHPIEMIRAITLTWLFSGQRSDEIARLRVGCVRWQHDGTPIPGDTDQVLARDAVCLLDVPTHKTGTAFTKPVDPLLGQAIEAWQAVRPAQPKMLDRKTGERVDFLFAVRARRVAKHYINDEDHPDALRQGRRPRRRRPRQDHQPPGPLHDRVPALQRQGTDDAVRAAGLARARALPKPPSTTRRSPRTR